MLTHNGWGAVMYTARYQGGNHRCPYLSASMRGRPPGCVRASVPSNRLDLHYIEIGYRIRCIKKYVCHLFYVGHSNKSLHSRCALGHFKVHAYPYRPVEVTPWRVINACPQPTIVVQPLTQICWRERAVLDRVAWGRRPERGTWFYATLPLGRRRAAISVPRCVLLLIGACRELSLRVFYPLSSDPLSQHASLVDTPLA